MGLRRYFITGKPHRMFNEVAPMHEIVAASLPDAFKAASEAMGPDCVVLECMGSVEERPTVEYLRAFAYDPHGGSFHPDYTPDYMKIRLERPGMTGAELAEHFARGGLSGEGLIYPKSRESDAKSFAVETKYHYLDAMLQELIDNWPDGADAVKP